MALIKCKECGEQVSSEAKACPKCGAKPPKKTSIITWIVLGFIVIVGYSAMHGTSSNVPNSASNTSAATSVTPAAEPVAPVRKTQWEISTSIDKMTGKRQVFAMSPTVDPTEPMAFPYKDVTAWVGVGCDGKSEWAFFGFSKAPNLTNTDIKDGYTDIKTRVKWDNSLQNVVLTQHWGASFLQFDDKRDAIAKIAVSKTALLELDWYGENHAYFSFPTDGAAASIADIRKKCSTPS